MWPHPTPRDHDVHKLESTLPEDPSKPLTPFMTKTYFGRFWKNISKFLLSYNHLPLKADMTLHFSKFKLSLLKDALCQFWLKSAQCFYSREEVENVKKVYKQKDAGQNVIINSHLRFQLK